MPPLSAGLSRASGGTSKQTAGPFSHPLAVLKTDDPVDDCRTIALRTLDIARRASGKITDQFGCQLGYGLRIEHIDVGLHPDSQRSAIPQTQHAGRPRRDPPETFLKGIEALPPHPVRENEARPSRIHDLGNVGAGIPERREDLPALQKIAKFIKILTEHP